MIWHLDYGIPGSGEDETLKCVLADGGERVPEAEKLVVFPSGVPMEYLGGGDRSPPTGESFQCGTVLFPQSQT